MNDNDIIVQFEPDPAKPPRPDWRTFDAMTEEERHAAALADLDSPQLPRRNWLARVAYPTSRPSTLKPTYVGGSEPGMRMLTLETDRLLIRPFTMDDLAAIHQLLDVELANADFGSEGAQSLAGRRQWLQWTVLNYEELAKLYQPPYGDRAIVLKDGQALIGACGYVPCLDAFGQLPAFGAAHDATRRGLTTTAFGLYWAVSPRYQRRGYATEAAGALVRYAFTNLNLRRIIATTTHENAASLGVMRKLGMRIERNPYPAPPWLQAVGILDNPALAANDEEQR